jgi:3-dehydroquinate dehydratase
MWKLKLKQKIFLTSKNDTITSKHSFRSILDWQTVNETNSTATKINIHFVDIAIDANQTHPIKFTFFWIEANHWENRNYQVTV